MFKHANVIVCIQLEVRNLNVGSSQVQNSCFNCVYILEPNMFRFSFTEGCYLIRKYRLIKNNKNSFLGRK